MRGGSVILTINNNNLVLFMHGSHLIEHLIMRWGGGELLDPVLFKKIRTTTTISISH